MTGEEGVARRHHRRKIVTDDSVCVIRDDVADRESGLGEQHPDGPPHLDGLFADVVGDRAVGARADDAGGVDEPRPCR